MSKIDEMLFFFLRKENHSNWEAARCFVTTDFVRGTTDGDEEENEDWNYRLQKFLKKATALIETATDPGYGLQLDIQEDVD